MSRLHKSLCHVYLANLAPVPISVYVRAINVAQFSMACLIDFVPVLSNNSNRCHRLHNVYTVASIVLPQQVMATSYLCKWYSTNTILMWELTQTIVALILGRLISCRVSWFFSGRPSLFSDLQLWCRYFVGICTNDWELNVQLECRAVFLPIWQRMDESFSMSIVWLSTAWIFHYFARRLACSSMY